MIDEKKLIEDFKEMEMPAIDIILGVIEQQPKTGEWIPVDEKLPEEGKYILLSFSNCTSPNIGRYETENGGGAFYIGDDDETCVQHDLFVNAWMPLPEPWEEEK